METVLHAQVVAVDGDGPTGNFAAELGRSLYQGDLHTAFAEFVGGGKSGEARTDNDGAGGAAGDFGQVEGIDLVAGGLGMGEAGVGGQTSQGSDAANAACFEEGTPGYVAIAEQASFGIAGVAGFSGWGLGGRSHGWRWLQSMEHDKESPQRCIGQVGYAGGDGFTPLRVKGSPFTRGRFTVGGCILGPKRFVMHHRLARVWDTRAYGIDEFLPQVSLEVTHGDRHY